MTSPEESLRAALAAASRGLVEREALVDLVALAAVAGEHLLVIGPPGTAKSEAARRVARALGLSYFEYLLGRFTEPSEIFGPVDLRKLREGVVETATAGMLPEAEIAFLDEVFLGSTAILNTLLSILNERTFRRGHTAVRVPLRLCIGASNAVPEDESLAAFGDRFLLRAFLRPLPDPRLEELLEGGWSLGEPGTGAQAATGRDLDALAARAKASDMTKVRPALAHALRTLRKAGITLSDRRAVRAQRVIAAAASLAGRDAPSEADLWPLVYVVPTEEGQRLARDALREQLATTESAALSAAAEDASRAPLARAGRLSAAARALLDAPPPSAEDAAAHRLKLEGVLREIDAGFAKEALPPALADVRAALVAATSQEATA